MTKESTTEQETCAVCGQGRVETRHLENVYKEGELAVKYLDEFFWCPVCGDEFYTTEQDMARSRAISIAIADARNAMTPDRIRAARLRLQWTQEEIQDAFGVGPKTWTRYERGTVAPSKAANFMLWMVEQHPEIVEEYRDRGKAALRELEVAGAIVSASTSDAFQMVNSKVSSTSTMTASSDQKYGTLRLLRA